MICSNGLRFLRTVVPTIAVSATYTHRDSVRSRCASRGGRSRLGKRRPRRTSTGRHPKPGAPRCVPACGRKCDPGATSNCALKSRSSLRYTSRNRLAADRSASGNLVGMKVWEKSGDARNSVSAAAKWTRRSGRSRSLIPSTSRIACSRSNSGDPEKATTRET